MPSETASIERLVEINGVQLPSDVESQLESVVVMDRLAMPDTFTLVFRDTERDVLKRAGIDIGKPVVISATSLTGDAPEPLIDGEITAIETDYDSMGARAVARGYDRSHRLAAGRKTMTYQNVKYSDIASQIAGNAGLTPDTEDSGAAIEHVLQANQSDLDFLYSLARRGGFELTVDGETLRFKKSVASSTGPDAGDPEDDSNPKNLKWDHNLLEFRARMSAVAQVADVKVRGWDVTNKEAVIGQADATADNATVSLTPSDLAGRVGGATLTVVDHPVDSQPAADALATARAQQVGSAAFEATAVALGSPVLKAGTAVNVKGIDPALEGKWVISGSRHEFGNGTYKTALEFTGRQDRSILGLLGQGGGGGVSGDRIPGVVIGIVTDNDDPNKQGRVKVSLPWLDDNAETWWARLAQPGAGNGYGMAWVPQSGDEVLVAFEQGSIANPFVIGGLWNGKDTAPLGDGLFDRGSVKRTGFVSRAGHKLIFFDDPDESGIALISHDNKFRISLNETKGALHVYFDGKLLLEGTGDVEVKTQGNFKVDASGVEIKASGQTAIKGATVALN
jgi:phage protein D